MKSWLRPLRRLALASAALATGCTGGPAFVPVTGTLTLDGRPLGEAEVVFVPDPAKGAAGDNASGTTDAQGRFTLRTGRTGRAGAPPGVYRVTVTDLSGVADLTAPDAAPPGDGLGGPRPVAPKRPRVPPAYADPSRTPLRGVEVRAGGPAFEFDLKAVRP